MSVIICFPHTPASQILGSHALANKYDVLLYMPTKIDCEWGEHILTDLKILAAMSGENTVTKAKVPDFSDPAAEIVFFPCLGEFLIMSNPIITPHHPTTDRT